MKMTLPTSKPRNPFGIAACRRQAGAHRRGAGAQRQALRRETERETVRELGQGSGRPSARHRPSP